MAIPALAILPTMEWLLTLGTQIILSLVGVSGQLAVLLDGAATAEPETIATATPLPSLPGNSPERDVIPRILLENPAYQQASLANSQGLIGGAATSNPAEALVNVFCTYRTPDSIRYTTGTGFFVTPTGVILTNAHVAQFLLLETVSETGTTECVVRHGDPAVPTYEAELLYISPMWIKEHANLIDDPEPKGTGERDYALLYLTGGVDSTPLPAQLPFLAVDTELRNRNTVGNTVSIAGYPTLDPDLLVRGGALERARATTTLVDLYTFDTNYGDIYFLGGSAIGKQGISGGPVIDQDNEAVALIVTRGDDSRQGAGSLNAITLSYIDRTITEETGFSLAQTMSGNITYKAYVFQQTLVPFLAAMLEREL